MCWTYVVPATWEEPDTINSGDDDDENGEDDDARWGQGKVRTYRQDQRS